MSTVRSYSVQICGVKMVTGENLGHAEQVLVGLETVMALSDCRLVSSLVARRNIFLFTVICSYKEFFFLFFFN